MSRWFRHYAGMVRDDKLVRASIKSKQSIERVVWVWGAVLESAAEIDSEGRYEVDSHEIARFLRCKATAVQAVLDALSNLGRIDGNAVTAWSRRQFKSDRSNDRVTEYRAKKRNSGNTDVTLQERDCNSPETETETETETEKSKTDKSVLATQRANRLPADFAVPPEWIAWAVSEPGLSRSQAETEAAKFIDYWHGKSGRDATKLDWQATWRNWCRNARPSRDNGYGVGHSGIPI